MEDEFEKFLIKILENLKEEIPKAVDEKLRSVEKWYALPERLKIRCCGSCRHFLKPSCPYFKYSDVIMETDPSCLNYEPVRGKLPGERKLVAEGTFEAKLRVAHERKITRVKAVKVKKITKNGLENFEVRYVLTMCPKPRLRKEVRPLERMIINRGGGG